MIIDSKDRSLIDEKMSGEERIFIAPKSNPYDGVGKRRVRRLSFRIKDTFENRVIELILV